MKLGLWKKGSGAPEVDVAALVRIKQSVRHILKLHDDATVAANELICADPACPGTETVILIMVPGQRTKAAKVMAAASDVTDAMLREALDHIG